MKKYIIVFLLLFANFAIAQETVAEPSSNIGSFFSIVLGTGIIGILIWLVIVTMFPCATILGIVSIIFCVKSDGSKLPFSFKWLIMSPLFYFLVGAVGVMYGVLLSWEGLAELENASAGARIANGIATSIDSAIYTLFGMVPFFFFILISMIILHFKKIPSPIEKEGTYE